MTQQLEHAPQTNKHINKQQNKTKQKAKTDSVEVKYVQVQNL